MERRDLIRDQIEQLGRVLGAIVARFLGTKAAGNVSEGIEIANESLRSQLDLDVDLILTLDPPALKEYLVLSRALFQYFIYVFVCPTFLSQTSKLTIHLAGEASVLRTTFLLSGVLCQFDV